MRGLIVTFLAVSCMALGAQAADQSTDQSAGMQKNDTAASPSTDTSKSVQSPSGYNSVGGDQDMNSEAAAPSTAKKPQTAATAPVNRTNSWWMGQANRDGFQVMDMIVRARSDLHMRNIADAKEDLRQARYFLDKIEGNSPASMLKSRLDIAKKQLDYESAHDVVTTLPAIYSELDSLKAEIYTDDVRSHLDVAKRELQKENKLTAQRELGFAEDAIPFNNSALPLSRTGRDIAAAQWFLDRGQSMKADKSLADLEKNLTVAMNSVPRVGQPMVSRNKANENKGTTSGAENSNTNTEDTNLDSSGSGL